MSAFIVKVTVLVLLLLLIDLKSYCCIKIQQCNFDKNQIKPAVHCDGLLPVFQASLFIL